MSYHIAVAITHKRTLLLGSWNRVWQVKCVCGYTTFKPIPKKKFIIHPKCQMFVESRTGTYLKLNVLEFYSNVWFMTSVVQLTFRYSIDWIPMRVIDTLSFYPSLYNVRQINRSESFVWNSNLYNFESDKQEFQQHIMHIVPLG